MAAIPNLLTLLRVLLTPFMVAALMVDDYRRAILYVVVAAATDGLDGFLARRYSWQTQLGAYLDPVADKLFLVNLYICLWLGNQVPGWLLAFIALRDIMLLLLAAIGLMFTTRRQYPPSIWGKITTVLQVTTALIVLVNAAYPGHIPSDLIPILCWFTAVSTGWSGLHYLIWGEATQSPIPEITHIRVDMNSDRPNEIELE